MKATYTEVYSHKTGHAEALQVTFDPNEVSYENLVDLFWSIHNPTTKNRHGWDIRTDNFRVKHRLFLLLLLNAFLDVMSISRRAKTYLVYGCNLVVNELDIC